MPFDPTAVSEYPPLIGCDEVGTGALCGPVVVAAVWFDPVAIPQSLFADLDDSKQLTRKRRTSLAVAIRLAARVSISVTSAEQVDKRGVRVATLSAMRRAIIRLGINAPVRIDGVVVPKRIPMQCMAIVRGDATVPQIAAASIVAKVFRDRLMIRLGRKFPDYNWQRNVGYGTAEHLIAIERFGPTRFHRMTYAPLLQPSLLFADGAADLELDSPTTSTACPIVSLV
ncbi:MAG: ribonuclease HII [Acidobacteriota bacterium]|nr:ribonuclease HII [Acidobacteriota bacterium]